MHCLGSVESTLSPGIADILIFYLFFHFNYRSEIQFLLWHFVSPLISVFSLLVDRKQKGGLVVVFLLGSSPTVDTENRAKRLQPNINSPLLVSGLVSVSMGFTKCQINDKLYFTTILD